MSDYTDLGSLLNPSEYMPDYVKPQEVEGRPLLLMSFEYAHSGFANSVYAKITCQDPFTGEVITVNTGASRVLQMLKTLEEVWDGATPIRIVFRTKGKAVYISAT